MLLENADFRNSELLHFLREPLVIFTELHVRVRVGRRRESNAFLDRETNNLVGGIKLVHRFAPAGGGQLDGKTAPSNEIERLRNEIADRRGWAMAVDLDQVEMGQAIDEAARGNLADAAKIIRIDSVDVAADELSGASRHAVEHLVWSIEVVNGPENEIEAVPIFLHPGAASGRGFRVVIQLEPGANSDVGICSSEFLDLVEIDPGVITIVVGESDVGQTAIAGAVDPWLKQRAAVGLDAMPLRVAVVIGKELRANS